MRNFVKVTAAVAAVVVVASVAFPREAAAQQHVWWWATIKAQKCAEGHKKHCPRDGKEQAQIAPKGKRQR